MFTDSGALAINPSLNPGLGYDPVRDFAPVTALASLPTIFSDIDRYAAVIRKLNLQIK